MLVNHAQDTLLSLSYKQLFRLGFALLVVAIAGCEDVPQLSRVANTTPIADNAVTSSGRGGYDWFFVNGGFDVTAPSELEVLSQIDRELVQKNLTSVTFTERTEPYRPAGMEDDVYYTFSRFTEPYFDTKPFLTIPFQASGEGLFSINSAGDRLAMIGKQLEIWDLNASKRLTSAPLPSSQCSRVIWDFNAENVLLMDNAGVHRVEAATGQVLKTWKPPKSDEPVYFVRAGNSTTCAVATKNKKMYAFGEDLQTTHEFKGPLLDTPTISIRPDANWVLGQAKGKIFRWHISPNREEMETLGELSKGEKLLFPVAGKFVDYLVEPQVYAICYNDPQTKLLTLLNCDSNPLVHAGGVGTVDGTQEWFTSCSSRPDSAGIRQFFIQDLSVDNAVFSVEFPLGAEPVLEMSLDQSTEVIAIRDAQQLRIYRRQRWKDLTGRWTIDRLANLAIDGRFTQLELAASELRKQPRLRRNSGEGFHLNLAWTIGTNWANLEVGVPPQSQDRKQSNTSKIKPDEKTQSILKALELWKSSGSELAILSSCLRHDEIGQRARGSGWASNVTQTGWAEYENRNKQIQAEIRPLKKKELPSLGCLNLEINSGLSLGKSVEDLQPTIKQLIERFPFSSAGHVELCIHMLPRWGGKAGEGGAYLASVADVLPQPYADLFYARVAIRFGEIYQPAIFASQESGISVSRMLRSVEPLLERNELWQNEVEFLIKLANISNRPDLIDKLANYHARHYALNGFAQTDHERTLLGKARTEMSK